jgi:hypothetical protein
MTRSGFENMFCPKCKYEYIQGIKECPDCNKQLVDILPEEEQKTYEYVDLVTVFIPRDMGELAFVKSLLEEAGIRYFAKNENMSRTFLGNGIGALSVQIQVSKADEDEVKTILKEI